LNKHELIFQIGEKTHW